MTRRLLNRWTVLAASTLLMALNFPPALASDQWATVAEGTATDRDPAVEWWKAFQNPLLERYILLAVEHNHDIRAARTRIDQARAFLKESQSRRLPEVNASADYFNARLSENGVGAGPAAARAGLVQLEDDFFRTGFDSRWEIDVFGSIRKEVQASQARVEEAQEDRRAVLLSVLAEVAAGYVELRGAQQRLKVVESNLRIQSETLRLVENKVKTGLARRIDAQRARALLESTRSALAPLQSEIRLAAFRLSVLTGSRPGALLEELLQANPLPAPPDLVPVGLPSELLARRPDLRRAERRIAAAGADLKSARADLYPRFSLTAAAGLESGAIGSLFRAASGNWALVPGLHLPLFNRGRLKSRVKASQAALQHEQIRFEQAYLLALEEVEGALVRYGRRQQEAERLQSAFEASAESVRLARILYQRGLADYLSVLDAERSLNDIELRLTATRTRLALDVIALFKSLGGGWEVHG